jgi:hypothetical protein
VWVPTSSEGGMALVLRAKQGQPVVEGRKRWAGEQGGSWAASINFFSI